MFPKLPIFKKKNEKKKTQQENQKQNLLSFSSYYTAEK